MNARSATLPNSSVVDDNHRSSTLRDIGNGRIRDHESVQQAGSRGNRNSSLTDPSADAVPSGPEQDVGVSSDIEVQEQFENDLLEPGLGPEQELPDDRTPDGCDEAQELSRTWEHGRVSRDNRNDVDREETEDVTTFETRRLLLDSWRVIWAIILTSGGRSFTKEQYQSVRNLAYGCAVMGTTSWKSDDSTDGDITGRKVSVMPHYSTLQKKYKPLVLNVLAPRSVEHVERVDETKAGAQFRARSETGDAQIPMRTILASEYARADMATPAVWAQMRSTSLLDAESASVRLSSALKSECVDSVPLVGARSWFYGPQAFMSVDCEGQDQECREYAYAEAGDTVRVELLDRIDEDSVSEDVWRVFGITRPSTGRVGFTGIYSHSWTVHVFRRMNDPSYREEYKYEVLHRDKEIAYVFNYLSYKSPTDSVSVEIPSIRLQDEGGSQQNETDYDGMTSRQTSAEEMESVKRREAALRERRRQMEAAWSMWEKPILKPGDFAVLLRPSRGGDRNYFDLDSHRTGTLLTDVDRSSRLCIVHRFWAERGERSRHIFFISGGCDLDGHQSCSQGNNTSLFQYCGQVSTNPTRKYAHVYSVALESEHGNERGPYKHSPVSSIGILDCGEPYFIYRIILFWDGFNVQIGNSASGEGVYMVCINLPRKARSSSNAVRILSLTPSGVKSNCVLHRILRDIVIGATEGFLDYDAEGRKRRIFLDLVGVLGDTPALNASLDVLGHTATACCHLCRFTRVSKTAIGCRYAHSVGSGVLSAYRRGFFQHAAIHDCGSQKEACRLMGINHSPETSNLPLHWYRSAMYEAKGRMRCDNDGRPVVSYHFDPYIASFVAPDHLLSGHLRDCISLVVKLLPTPEHLHLCERSILALLDEVGLRRQNRLFDHDKKTLFTMSMTEMFAVGIVAELGFLKGCAMIEDTSNECLVSDKCKRSIELVGSCARLIAKIWWRPEDRRDGKQAVLAYEHSHGLRNFNGIQRAVEEHIASVKCLCKFSDEDQDELEEGRCGREKMRDLSRKRRGAEMAIKCLDKPNIHRLRELAFTTIPMLGHVSLIGELVLEKAHQRLKRSLVRSNNKDAHLQSMYSVSIDDWQGRLTLISNGCYMGNDLELLACYRLLAGREAISAVNGNLSNDIKLHIRRLLGPERCILAELHCQRKSVLSPTSAPSSPIDWALKGMCRHIPAIPRHAESPLDHCIRTAFANVFRRNKVLIADCVSASSAEGDFRAIFRSGDVLQILCYHPYDHDYHFPFLHQKNTAKQGESLEESRAVSPWYMSHVLSINGSDGSTFARERQLYAVVKPCIVDEGQQSPTQSSFWNGAIHSFDTYQVDATRNYSFAELDATIRKAGVIRKALRISDTTNRPIENRFLALTRAKGFPPWQGYSPGIQIASTRRFKALRMISAH